MSAKHRLKLFLREAYARTLFHTGLHRVVDAWMPPRLTILAGHCVAPTANIGKGFLPADMQISEDRLERILAWFKRRYPVTSVGEGWRALPKSKRSIVALSMDDGYRDNRRLMLPILQRVDAGATVYLESRPLDERRVNWSHKYFWLLSRMEFRQLAERYTELSADPAAAAAVRAVLDQGRADPRYHVKRVLKYDAAPADRDRVIDAIFAEAGGDERELCDALYMDWNEARELAAAGVELGGHTIEHVILSRCAPELAEHEIVAGAAALTRELGAAPRSFAYPWGRRWDFDAHSQDVVARAGFESAVTMHAGVNTPRTKPTELKRLAIDDNARLHVLAAEACGGFELLRKVGIDLSE